MEGTPSLATEDEALLTRVQVEVMALFQRNVGLADTLPGIASRVGRDPGLVALAVQRLVERGILTKQGESQGLPKAAPRRSAVYRYSPPVVQPIGPAADEEEAETADEETDGAQSLGSPHL
ncbi:MAG: hypothetical protein IMW99_02165 [Firmicutes bacterium]|nr:hypothetical protein [Bacillota bacterium]